MPLLLALAFLVVPIVEIYVIIQVGQVIGAAPTILLLILDSVLGVWLVRREGRRAWRALQQAIGSGRMPARELADAALILVGGTLLLTPGFLTDILGFFLVVPVTRPLARRLLGWVIGRRMLRTSGGSGYPPTNRWPPAGSADAAGGRPGRVVPGVVVDDYESPGDRPEPGDADRSGTGQEGGSARRS